MVRPDFFEIETYTRETTLQAALEKATKLSRPNTCVTTSRYPDKHARDISRGVPLGGTVFKQLGWTASFDAHLRGDFFGNLKLVPTRDGVEFRNNRDLVSSFSGSLELIVFPAIRKEPNGVESPTSPLWGMMGGWRFTEALKGLRFHIVWVGSETRDLGEIPAELKSELVSKKAPPENWYQMEVPANGVPIADSMEIHILSPAGNQLGCISRHL